MKLGPIQKQWIAALRDNPDQQINRQLGKLVDGQEYFCCLGKGLTIVNPPNWVEYNDVAGNSYLVSGDNRSFLDEEIYPKLGLHDVYGSFKEPIEFYFGAIRSLYEMNDNAFTWAEIADYMEQHPENVFAESK
jgi:hypothetical protein